MTATERQYLARNPDGEEMGPVSREGLKKLVQQGRVTQECEGRSTLVPRWLPAADIDFLTNALAEQERSEDGEKGARRKKKKTTGSTPQKERQSYSIMDNRAFTPVTGGRRVLAAGFDIVILFFYVIALNAIMDGVFASPQAPLPATLHIALLFFGVLLYPTWTIAFNSQTPGQKFWGIMVVTRDLGPVLMGRSFFHALFAMLFGIITPALTYVLPSNRSLPEMLTGTRVVRTRVIYART